MSQKELDHSFLTLSASECEELSHDEVDSISSTLTASEPEKVTSESLDNHSDSFSSFTTLTALECGEKDRVSYQEGLSLGTSSVANSPRKHVSTSSPINSLSVDIDVDTLKRKPKDITRNVKRRRIHFFGDIPVARVKCIPRKKSIYQIARRTITELRQKVKTLQQKTRRMKSQINSLNAVIDQLREKKLISENAVPNLYASLSGPAKDIFNSMLRKTRPQKYSPELRKFALTLHFYSAKSYNYLRETFLKYLPHERTLSKWYETVHSSPGFSKTSIEALKLKVIHKRVEWDGKKFYGYIDFGIDLESDGVDEAKEVLVFLLVALNAEWKIPVGYFFVNGLCGSEKANLVNNCLKVIYETGVEIKSLTFDDTPTNLTVARQLGANLKISQLTTHFLHPISKEKIYIFLDPSHMVKLVRNCFGNKRRLRTRKFQKSQVVFGQIINWEYIEKLQNIQVTEGLHLGTKLTKRHIGWVKEKMKVKLSSL